jgi:hypothetical protein
MAGASHCFTASLRSEPDSAAATDNNAADEFKMMLFMQKSLRRDTGRVLETASCMSGGQIEFPCLIQR